MSQIRRSGASKGRGTAARPRRERDTPNEQEIERILAFFGQSASWCAAGLCGCCGEPPVDGEHCAKAVALRVAHAHIGNFYRQRADAKGPPCTITVRPNGDWGTGGSQWGDQPFAFFGNIIEECTPDDDGAFECHARMELAWDGHMLEAQPS